MAKAGFKGTGEGGRPGGVSNSGDNVCGGHTESTQGLAGSDDHFPVDCPTCWPDLPEADRYTEQL